MIKEEFVSEDKNVVKLIHDDGVESVWKFNSSCDGTNNEKAVLFVSSSFGCSVGCEFCWLTQNDVKYKKISQETFIRNIKDSLRWLYDWGFEFESYNFKLSFMGMGDIFIESFDIYQIGIIALDEALLYKFKGLDGIDICTSFPTTIFNNHGTREKFYSMVELNSVAIKGMYSHRLNKNNDYSKRSFVRLFISMHSADQYTRALLFPNSVGINSIGAILDNSKISNKINLIFHYIPFKNINDSLTQIEDIVDFAKKYNAEIRLLRYNENYKNKGFIESPRFNSIVDIFKSRYHKVKSQVSIGKEVTSACGQFMAGSVKTVEELKFEEKIDGVFLNVDYNVDIQYKEIILDKDIKKFYDSKDIDLKYLKNYTIYKGIELDDKLYVRLSEKDIDNKMREYYIGQKKLASMISTLKSKGFSDDDINNFILHCNSIKVAKSL